TIFAQCHHGWCYYPTKTDMRHPHLQTDLVGRMLAAGKKAGINMPVYITVQWHDKASREHPEWCVRRPDGSIEGPPPKHPHSPKKQGWYRLCCNTPYLEESVLTVTREVMEMYNPSGIFLDITGESACLCDWCLRDMREKGLNTDNAGDRMVQARDVYKKYLKATSEIVWAHNPDATLYHNSSDKKGRHDLYPYWSHYEIESLPTGLWGYNHFPVNARYFTMLPDCQVISQTGKFHRMWGEFGGFKNPIALQYEVGQITSLGCHCMVGDQLHPNGKMDEETYRIIGEAYERVEAREAWLEGAVSVADVAILSPSAVHKNRELECSENGAGLMLMEAQIPFAVLDETMDFAPYRLLILPDSVLVDDELKSELNAFVAAGGKLLLSGDSGLNPARNGFAVDIGAEFEGMSPWDVEYIVVGDEVADQMVRTPFLVYESGVTTTVGDAEVLAETWQPYFNRTYGHFCSHRNTPYDKPADWPAVIRKGGVIHIAQPIFRVYDDQGMQLHRDLVLNCIDLLYDEPLLTVNLPSCGRVGLMRQPQENDRLVLHLMYAVPIKRGQTHVIEDIVPLTDVAVSVRAPREPTRVYLAPEDSDLDVSWSDGRLEFVLPRLEMNQIVVIE
ncbi:MAG: beta-galactosidase, partial [Lentisphaerae bacterium]|nr:beta-galactosidase [Lentisphaerota bacterium]